MAHDALFNLKNEIMELADIFALAVLRHQAPAQDEISYSVACKAFGRAWLDLQVQRSRVKGVRHGKCKNSPLMFSRLELLALKEAEKRSAEMVRKSNQ